MENSGEILRGFKTRLKISQELVTSPKVWPQCEKALEKANVAYEIINALDEECVEFHEESSQLWTTLIENEQLKEIDKKLHIAQEKEQSIHESMINLFGIEKRNKMA